MSYRVLVAFASVVAVVVGALVPTAGQESRSFSGAETGLAGLLAPADGATLPMTPWGHPDLRGVWNNSTNTPLEHMTETEGDILVIETERFNNQLDGGDYQPSHVIQTSTPWPRRHDAVGRTPQNGRRQHDRLSANGR